MTGTKKIWIKANGNEEVATGHIRRCMTIAEELIKRGWSAEFILSDANSANVLKTLSKEDNVFFDARIMHTAYSEPMGDMEVLKEYFREEVPDFFLADSIFVTPEYFNALHDIIPEGKVVRTGYIDDRDKSDYPVNLVINYNIEPGDIYQSAEVKLLGGEYAPLREEFSESTYSVKDSAKKAFLSAGGTDPRGVIGKILNEIYEGDSPCRKVLDFTGIECEVIVGALFDADYRRELREIAGRHQGITLHDQVEAMRGLMEKCDFAVSAGGATLFELCALGVPTVGFSMTDSQAEFVEAFDRVGAVKYAGDARTDHRLVQKIVTWGTAAIDNRGFRNRMSSKAKSIIDGKGIYRIADAIESLVTKDK